MSSSFQPSAFQDDAFQNEAAAPEDAFQCGAFQASAFQTCPATGGGFVEDDDAVAAVATIRPLESPSGGVWSAFLRTTLATPKREPKEEEEALLIALLH